MAAAAAIPYLVVSVRGDRLAVAYVLLEGTVVVAVAWRASRRAVDLRRLDLSALRTSVGRRRVRRLFVSAGTFGFTVGFSFWFPFGFAHGFAEGGGLVLGLQVGFGVGALFGTAFGLVGGLAGALATHPAATDRPSRPLRQGLVHLTAVITAMGLVVGLIAGLGVGFIDGPIDGLVTGLAWALVVGLPVGLVVVANSPWPRYLIATTILARRGDLPRRPAVFLDWAYGAGLMRLSGIAVQFRHREFQTWLTTRSQPTEDRAAAVANTGLVAKDGSKG